MGELIKRIELINICISLGDSDLIQMQSTLLETLQGNEQTDTIIALLASENYIKAKKEIDTFLQQHSLVENSTPEIEALNLKLKWLEKKLQDSLIQRDKMFNTSVHFNRDYLLNLGPTIDEILHIKN